jgi:heat-inducible transcriptional repressor
MTYHGLTERERTILQAVIEAYIETAEPAGSRRIVQRSDMDISAATARNTMADLEMKGYLTHPHTSAGRMPTDLAYRYYVDTLMGRRDVSTRQRARIEKELTGPPSTSELESIVQRAARVLGLLTGELGLSLGPILAEAVLLKLDFVPIDSGKALMVLTLGSGVVRTVYVDLPAALPAETLAAVARIMNERLAGSTLRDIHGTLVERLRDIQVTDPSAEALVNIFVESGPDMFEWVLGEEDVHLGNVSLLAKQPEFHSGARLKELMELTEQRQLLASVLHGRATAGGSSITIGAENGAPELAGLTIITATYKLEQVEGVVGVIGPTRMPYEKVLAVVECTSSLVSSLVAH